VDISAGIPVNVTAVAYLDHFDDEFLIQDVVEDSIRPLKNAKLVLSREFGAARWARLIAQGFDPLQNPPDVDGGQPA
jgi:hypothetical protein